MSGIKEAVDPLARLAEFDSRKIAGEVLRRIEEHPEQHDQTFWLIERRRPTTWWHNFARKQLVLLKKPAHDWPCGTTACVAGFAVAAALAEDPGLRLQSHADGEIQFVAAASALLGLNESESNWLFFYSNNEEAVEAVARIAAGEPPLVGG